MTETKKFLFDTKNFDETKPEVTLYTEEQLALAKSQSLAAGKADGIKETRAQQEELIAGLLQKVLAQAERLAKNEDRREVEKCIDAARLTMRIIHKLMPGLAGQHALGEIERVITQSIEARRDEPRLAIVVPTVHLEALRARVDALTLDKSYAGKLILISDDNMPPTDCRVEWADGGAERLYERLLSQVDNELAKAVSGMNATIEPEKK